MIPTVMIPIPISIPIKLSEETIMRKAWKDDLKSMMLLRAKDH